MMYPEREFVEARKAAVKQSMVQAGVITLGALAIATAGLLWSMNRRL